MSEVAVTLSQPVVPRNMPGRIRNLLNNSLPILIILLSLFLSGYIFIDCWVAGQFPVPYLAGIILPAILGLWVLYGMISLNATIRKKGLDPEKNKSMIDRLLREDYKDFHFHLRESETLSIRLWTMQNPGKEIRVYYRENDVLINIRTLLRYGNMKSPYHVIANRQESREILRRLEQRIKEYEA